MKVRKQHQFFVYASHFSIKSMIRMVSYWAYVTAKCPQKELKYIARKEKYEVSINGAIVSGTVQIVQTWLVDMLYQISTLKQEGKKEITKEETLYLIALYNDYDDQCAKDRIKTNSNVLMQVIGAFGEQNKFQSPSNYIREFSREKYILDTISYKSENEEGINIDIKKEFHEITGFSTDEYSAIVFLLYSHFSQTSESLSIPIKTDGLKMPIFSLENIQKIISRYSIPFQEIKRSALNRQVFYLKPIIKFENEYICANPLLLLSAFANCIYWVIRNKYFELNSQRFINAFGHYFETYIEEVLENCLKPSDFMKIPESDHEKRADLYVKLGEYEMIVEQKSALAALQIKQNHPDVDAMKNHFHKTWGKAIKQLESTQKYLCVDNPIKIILVYEDYFKSVLLKEFLDMNPNIQNDHKYWLVSVSEFENLLCLYKKNPGLALQIIKEKDTEQISEGHQVSDLTLLFSKNNVDSDLYLSDQGILDKEFGCITEMWL